jgi:hypothetical protein
MANKFRPIKQTPVLEPEHSAVNTPKEQLKNRVKTPNNKRFKGKTVKKIRRAFIDIFGLGMLKKINLRKNLPYFIMVILMIIVLIYNSLNIQSKKIKIEQLEDDITKINDMLMDAVEEEYNIDEKREKELLQTAIEEGFQNSGYIPYTIKGEK